MRALSQAKAVAPAGVGRGPWGTSPRDGVLFLRASDVAGIGRALMASSMLSVTSGRQVCANTSAAISVAASSCIAGMACE